MLNNESPDIATGVVVQDNLPEGLVYVTDTANCIEDPPGILTCELGDMDVSETRDFRIKMIVKSDIVSRKGNPTTITNKTEVFSNITDCDTSNNSDETVTIVTDQADPRVSKICKPDRPLGAGEKGTCTIFVDNLGPSSARNVRLKDTFLSNGSFEINSVTTTHGSCNEPDDGVIDCNLGDLDAETASENWTRNRHH